MKSQKIFKNYGITYFEAVNDVTALFENLNENHLLNVTKKEYKNRIKSFFVFLYTFQFDQIFRLLNTKKRYDIPGKFRSPLLLYIFFFVKLLVIHPIIFLGMYLFFISSPFIDYGKGLVFTLNIFLSMATHEFFHALALYLVNESEKLSFLGKDKFTIGIYRRQLSPFKSIFVALSGPLFPFIIGLYLYKLGENAGTQDIIYISIIWVANILTLLSTDRKNIKNSLFELIKKRGLKNG
ncbi:hypothetical protein AZI98_07420 [Aeribacillus pallidus]|uniref:DUF3267 domain-containing protein n=1 Tax=Aeribacillus pallidus TaxID=33936 RepID=A0A165Y4K0_9BACI|nr:hypothetical protein [Aeribacillus pallidus]KZN96722.1 hypothetical protein AZI98_07420 [Aeribacillus pallidus]